MTTAPASPSTDPGAAAVRGRPAAAFAAAHSSDLITRVTSPKVLLAVASLSAAFVLLFRHWLLTQHKNSWGNADWSHAYMVPLISLYLLWQHRASLERIRTTVFWPGVVPIVMGVWSYIYFIVGLPNHLGQGLAMILTLFGVVLLMLGPRVMRYAFLPIAYLVFAITVPEKIMNYVTWPLQILAAQGGWIGLNLFGVKTDIMGNQLMVFDTTTLATHPLNVAEACSGMRMLIAFLALGGAVSLVATRTWWKRIVLLGLAAPVALLLNVIRIMVLGFLVLYDPGLSTGAAHTLIGTLLLIPGFFIYMGVVVALHKAVPEAARQPAGGAA